MKSKISSFMGAVVIHTVAMMIINKGFLLNIKFLSMYFLIALLEAISFILIPILYENYPKQILSAIFFSVLLGIIFVVAFHFITKLHLTTLSVVLIVLGIICVSASINLFIFNFVLGHVKPIKKLHEKDLY